MADNCKLFSMFPPTSTEEWKAKIVKDLKGKDYEKKLVWRTSEGFNVNPFYRAEDLEGLAQTKALPGEFPYIRGTKKDNNWLVRQEIDVTDVTTANAKALDILNKGVDSLCFKLKTEQITAKNIALLLGQIVPTAIEVNFEVSAFDATTLVQTLIAYFKNQQYPLDQIKGSVSFDPFTQMTKTGSDFADFASEAKKVIEIIKELPLFKLLQVNGLAVNNAGSFISQELGYALACGANYLTALTEVGLSVDEVAPLIKFNFGVSNNYFMEIAKFRAARLLWAQIVDSFKPTNKSIAKMAIHAETSSYNLAVFDAHVNLLRTQTEAMSAALGGVDSMTVTAFDKTYTTPDEFSEHLARNQQLLLKEESHFEKVVDVAGGSYYLENLTSSIAEQAWKYFLAIDEQGGYYKAIKNGYIQEQLAASSLKHRQAMGKRRESLLGTNQFPNFNETALEKIETEKVEKREGTMIKPFVFDRKATDFEQLRLATEKAEKRPKAFMLTIGKLAFRLARAQFSSNFLAVAGYEIIDNLGFETVKDGVDAAKKAGADIIVLCSSDEEYETYAPEAKELIGKDAVMIVAGAPACMETLQTKGIEDFVHVRSNVLETLQKLNSKLGI